MRDLHAWPTNPFDDIGISITNLVTFATDNITRMTKNDPGGLFTARIPATTAALAAVNSAFIADQNKFGERKTANQAKAAFRKALPAATDGIYIALQKQYGKKAPQLATFFPSGLGEFNRTRDETMEDALQGLVTELTNNETDVGADLVTAAAALLTGWQAVHSPSDEKAGVKDAAMLAKRTARANLQLQLFLNLLTIAINFPRQPEMVDVYMQQSLLGPHTPAPSTPPAPPTPPAPTSAVTLGIHDSPAQLLINVTGTAPVSWVVESSTDESHWSDLATIDGSADTWAITDTTLYYRARGVDAQGNTVIADSNDVLMSRDS